MIESTLQGQVLSVPLPEVPLADHPGRVAGVAQGLGERALVEEHSVAPIERNAKLHAVLPGIAAGEEGGAGRRTYRMNVELRELDSLVGDAVHVGSGHLRTAVETGLPPAHVVGEEYQDVGPCVCSLIRLCGKLARRRTVRRYRALREGVPARQNDKEARAKTARLRP